MKIRVCIAGATGRLGKPICSAVAAAEDMSLVGAVAPNHQSQNLKDVTGDGNLDLVIGGSVAEILRIPADVFVDYTRTDVVKAHVTAAIDNGMHVVIGTSGLTETDYAEIHQAALDKGVGVITGNFSVTAALLQRFACEAAKYVPQWEIIDYASDTKIDAPSGTARDLASRVSEVGRPDITIPLDRTIGARECRGASLNGTQVHSLRLSGIVNGVEIIFGTGDERLSIRHDAGSPASPYIQGTLLAIRNVRHHRGLVRGLDRIMG